MRPRRTRHAYLAVALIAAVCFALLPAGAQTRRTHRLVERVEVQGNRRLKGDAILAMIKTRTGDVFNKRRVQRDLERILASGLFDLRRTRVVEMQGARGGVEIFFEVAELPLILGVTFKGLEGSGITEAEIAKLLRDRRINVAKGELYDPDKVNAASQVVKDLLAARGLEQIAVIPLVKVESYDGVSIEFSLEYAKHY